MERPLLCALALLLVAGCLAPSPGPGPTAPEDAFDPALPFTWSYNATTCHEADLVLIVDKAKLQSALPEGFVAAEATKLTPLPARPPAGKGAMLVAAFACGADGNDLGEPIFEGQLAILIEPPNVAGDRPAAGLELYETARYVNDGTQRRILAATGWDHFEGEGKAEASRTSGSAEMVGPDGERDVAFTTTTPAAADFSGVGRFWQDLPGGVAYFDYTFNATIDQLLGTASCDIRAGSPLHKLSGVTACTPDNAVGSGFTQLAPAVVLHYLPGVRAE